MYGTDTLKPSDRLANHTSRTFVMTKVPRLPCSELRFHTPGTVEYTSSCGKSRSCFSWMIAQRIFECACARARP